MPIDEATRADLTVADYARDDFAGACIFTNKPVVKSTGEHVIPRWMLAAYGLGSRKVQLGEHAHLADMRQFRAPADPDANARFGRLEKLVKNGQANLDELHIWQKKISIGMVLNHWRLARNIQHPRAPGPLDPRYLALALKDFQEDFALLERGTYSRTGSTLVLPTAVRGGWMANAFGAVVQDLSERHDGILPFAIVITSHGARLIVSVLHDVTLGFEAGGFATEWRDAALENEVSPLKVHAALAIRLAEYLARSCERAFGRSASLQDWIHAVAYQLGIVVDLEAMTFRARVAADLMPQPLRMDGMLGP
jgi:hypothetical protein